MIYKERRNSNDFYLSEKSLINGIIIKESEIILYFYESKLDLRDLKKQNSLSKSLELYN